MRAVDRNAEVVAVAGRVQRAHRSPPLDRIAVGEPRIGAHVCRGVREERHAVPAQYSTPTM
jgi:hypothetical protein